MDILDDVDPTKMCIECFTWLVKPDIPAHAAPLVFKYMVVPEHVDLSKFSGEPVIPEDAAPLD